MTVRTYVEYLIPGIMMSETETREVPDRNVQREATAAPLQAFAFRYYDIVETHVRVDGELVKLTSAARNKTARYYLGGELYSYEQVRALGPGTDILARNMLSNGWNPVLKTRCGNWQPLEEGDRVV